MSATDDHKLPSLVPTILITALVGVFGLIPASMAAAHARSVGANGRRYWKAFAATFAITNLLLLMIVSLIVFQMGGFGGMFRPDPVTWEKLPPSLMGFSHAPLSSNSKGRIADGEGVYYGVNAGSNATLQRKLNLYVNSKEERGGAPYEGVTCSFPIVVNWRCWAPVGSRYVFIYPEFAYFPDPPKEQVAAAVKEAVLAFS
jgi:hypothetical protein